CFHCSVPPRHLHPFPTRRSSDLMLSEALRRRSRGEDVVIGFIETHGRKGIEELAEQMDAVPRKKIEYKGTIFEEMDVDAILARRSEEHTSELQSRFDLVCRLLLE